jgi:signal transduction histidine kinase
VTDSDRFETLQRALARGEHLSQVVLLYRSDGTPFWGRMSLAPVTDGAGETTHIVGFLQDVTETKEHKEEIQRRLNEFGEVLAEDLRHPLEAVRAGLEAVEVDDEDVESAERALSQMENLIEDLATVHSSTVKSRNVFDSPPTAGEGD